MCFKGSTSLGRMYWQVEKKCNFPHFSTVKSAIFCTKKNADRWLRYANHQDLGCGYLLL